MGKSSGKIILSVGLFFVGAGMWGQGLLGLTGASASLVGGLYGAALGSSLWTATHQEDNSSTSSYTFDALNNQVSSRERIPLIYGTRKWAGFVSWHNVYNDKTEIYKDIIWCEGDISGISDVRANDIKISSIDDASYTFKPGSTADEHPDNYLVVGGYRRCAWSRFHFKSNDLVSGNPTVTAVVKGKLVRDTRTSSYGYSENCAMCVRDYLLSKRYGAGHFIDESAIDEDSFKEVADYCDALVTTKVPTTLSDADAVNSKISELQQYLTVETGLSSDERDNINDEITRLTNSLINIATQPVEYTIIVTPRYALNIVISEQKTHLEILQDMLATFGGLLVFCNNKVSLRCEKILTPSFDFNDDNVIEDTLVHTQYPIESSPNRYNVTFYDPDNYYTGVKIVVDDTVSQKERGKLISKDIDLVGCTSQSQALRLARMYRDKVALCQVVVTFSTATMAMHLEPGDVVTLSKYIYPDGVQMLLFDKIPFRILEIAEDNGTYSLKCEQYNSTIYNDTLGAQIQVGNYVTVPNPSEPPEPVTNLSLSQFSWLGSSGYYVYNIDLTFTAPSYLYSLSYIVTVSTDGGTTWRYISTVEDTKYRIENLAIGEYMVGVQAMNKFGVTGTKTISSITVASEATPVPDAVSAFTVTYLNGDYVFTWKKPTVSADILGYEVRKGSTWDSGQVVVRAMGSDTDTATSLALLGTVKFFCKPYNVGGYSETALSDLITIDVLPLVQVLYSENNFAQLCTVTGDGGVTDSFIYQSTNVTYADIENQTWDVLGPSNLLGTPLGNVVLLGPVVTLSSLVQAMVSITESWVIYPDVPNIYEISTSLDGVNFSDFKLLSSGSIPMKAFRLRITLDGAEVPAVLSDLKVQVVAAQKTQNYIGITVPVGGLELVFDQAFFSAPSVIVSPNIDALISKKDAATTTGCKIYLLNSSNEDVGGTADVWVVGI